MNISDNYFPYISLYICPTWVVIRQVKQNALAAASLLPRAICTIYINNNRLHLGHPTVLMFSAIKIGSLLRQNTFNSWVA